MSRSYKKTPGYTCDYGGKFRRFFKRYSNKIMRKMDIPDGNSYKKNGYSWSICDYKMLYFNSDIDDKGGRK